MKKVTLYNHYENIETGQAEWRRTVLSGTRASGQDAVHWEDSRTAKSLTGGLRTADVMIWHSAAADGGKTYLPPKAYGATAPSDIGRYWTLTPGKDRILQGEGPEVSGGMEALVREADGIATVTGVDDLRFGSPALWHFEVTTK